MYKKRRHRLEGLQLAVLRDLLRETDIEQAGRRMIGNAFKHVEILVRECNAADTITDTDYPEQFVTGGQRGANPVAPGAKMAGVPASKNFGRPVPRTVDVGRIAMQAEVIRDLGELGWTDARRVGRVRK